MRLTSTRLTFTAGLALILGGLAFAMAAPGGAQPAPPGTEPPTPTPTNVPGSIIAWNEVADATFPDPAAAEESIDLTEGRYRETAGFADEGSGRAIDLADIRAYGDLDGDGDLDAAGVLSETNDGAVTRYLVAILDSDGEAEPVASVALGQDIIVRGLEIAEGQIRVRFGAEPEQHNAFPETETLRVYALGEDELMLVSEEEVPFSLPPGGRDGFAPTRITLHPSGRPASVTATTDADTIADFVVHADEGETLAVSVEGPLPLLSLSIYGLESGEVLLSVLDEETTFSGTVPATQDYAIRVVPLGGGRLDYTLTLSRGRPGARSAMDFITFVPEVIHQGPLPTPTPTATPRATTTPEPTATPTAPPEPTATPEPSGPTIYLTFDDGPNSPYTEQILDLLAAHGAAATFFVLGIQIEQYPALIEAEAASGHPVANHTYDHVSLDQVSREKFFSEVQSTQALIDAHAGDAATMCLRPPYGAMNALTEAYAAELGYELVLWSVDPEDWAQPGVEAIVSSVLAGAVDGAIVLFHDGGGDRSQTVAALDTVLSELSNRGYRFASLRC